MSVYKRGGRWYYDFMIRRTRYRAAIPEARTKQQAERVETEAREAIYQGRYGQVSATITFAAFVEKTYLPWAQLHKVSWRHDVLRLKPALAAFGAKPLAEIAPFQIEKWKLERMRAPAKHGRSKRAHQRAPATVNHELAVVTTVLGLALDQGLIGSNPARKVKKLPLDNQRTRVCSLEEEQQLRAALPPNLSAMFVCALNTSLRAGRLGALLWSGVDFARNTISVGGTSNKRAVTVPMNKVVRDTLLSLRATQAATEERVFVGRTGRQYLKPGNNFARTCKRLGITGLRWHDLRHTAATRMGDAGASVPVLMEILGHSNPKTTLRYTHATDDAKRRAVASLETYAENDCPKIVAIDERRRTP